MTYGFMCDECFNWQRDMVKHKSEYKVTKHIEESWGEWRVPIRVDKDLCEYCYKKQLEIHNAKDLTIEDFPDIRRINENNETVKTPELTEEEIEKVDKDEFSKSVIRKRIKDGKI